MNNILLPLLLLSGAILLGGCGDDDDDSVRANASTLTSVTVGGTVDEPSTVVVNGLPDSDPDPFAFSVTVPVSEDATGADLALLITTTDGDLNSSSQAIDMTIVK